MKQSDRFQLIQGDSLAVLRSMAPQQFDSMVTDPPAGIGLLGLDWDKDKGGRDQWIDWMTEVMSESLRVLKPGAYALIWALPRTSHWSATALEDAGFEVRDVITHVFGSGFPKSMAMDKAIDRARVHDTETIYRVTGWIRARCQKLGLTNADLDRVSGVKGGACHWTAERFSSQPSIPTLERWLKLETVLGPAPEWMIPLLKPSREPGDSWEQREVVGNYESGGGGLVGKRFEGSGRITEPATAEAKRWKGWGTALKPASEHWILARKPLSAHNVAANVLKHGTGAIHIDACRVPSDQPMASRQNIDLTRGGYLSKNRERAKDSVYRPDPHGRFPTNLLLSKSNGPDCPVTLLNDATTEIGGASRYFQTFDADSPFFYCAKPSTREKGQDNNHPTVKPIALMRYLCRLITPTDGIVLDPFTGSGTTGVAAIRDGFRFVGIEREPSYYQIAMNRLCQTTPTAISTAA